MQGYSLLTGIILVGGLGASPYLYDHLKAIYAKNGIEILQSGGIRPRTAICHGAVLKGCLNATVTGPDDMSRSLNVDAPIRVTSTVSRVHLGSAFDTPFIVGQHAEEDKVWNEHQWAYMAHNQIQWYLTKGENVAGANPVRHSWSRTFSKDQVSPAFTETIYQCEESVRPHRLTSSIKPLCTIDYTLDVPVSTLENWVNPKGVTHKRFSFELEMKPAGATVEFAVYFDGRRQGGQHVNVRFM